MLDFVILFHELPADNERDSHWDLMLLDGDGLLTWALEANPLTQDQCSGTRLPVHRLEYLDYEGEVAGGRGAVRRVARGHYRWIEGKGQTDWCVELVIDGEGLIEIRCQNDDRFEFLRPANS